MGVLASDVKSLFEMSLDQDTIAAIATPVGRAGIGIIRVSGPLCRRIVQHVFRPRQAAPSLQSHRLYLGDLLDPAIGEVVDEVLVSVMHAPRTYTREDVVEINSHSGYTLLSKILDILLAQGARLARPGEFTLRAFLNGRIDLTQAEAVVDIINARSERGLRLASQQIQGAFREAIEGLRQNAVHLLARVEAAIDFPEAETEQPLRTHGAQEIEEQLMGPIQSLLASCDNRIWVDGVRTVIAGRVNAGKSSLMNRLLNEERAIVTPIPGTTRDIIESSVTVEGIPLRLMDTAGFRSVEDEVEQMGMTMARKKLQEADVVLIVIDRSIPPGQEDLDIVRQAKDKPALIVFNKIDLPDRLHAGGVNADALSQLPSVPISALTGEGLDALKQAMKHAILGNGVDTASSRATPNARHRHALNRALRSFGEAAVRTREDAPMEIVALELNSGLDALGEITGETTPEDVLDSIFSHFCLGK